MINKIFLLSGVLTLASCTTYYEAKNCDPEKNYINTNIEALNNYTKLVENGQYTSYYYKATPTPRCENNQCFYYNKNKNEFFEMYFDDSTRQGVYTIKISEDPNDKNCIKKEYSPDKNCYIVRKNKDDIIKSRYTLEGVYTDGSTYKKMTDLSNNTILYEMQYQYYSKPKITDEPSGGRCPIKKRNNPDYNLNTSNYPIR